MRIEKVIRKSVLLTFVVDKESYTILENGFKFSLVGNKLTAEEEIESRLRETNQSIFFTSS